MFVFYSPMIGARAAPVKKKEGWCIQTAKCSLPHKGVNASKEQRALGRARGSMSEMADFVSQRRTVLPKRWQWDTSRALL